MRDEKHIDGPTLDRRRVLQALGAGTALAGLGTGTAAADDHCYPEELVSGDDVHSAFGFSALEADVEPPVEPDHEIEAMIRPVEGREIPEFFYEPTELFVEPDDTVRFTLARITPSPPTTPRSGRSSAFPTAFHRSPRRSSRAAPTGSAPSRPRASTTSTAAPTSRSATPGGSSRAP